MAFAGVGGANHRHCLRGSQNRGPYRREVWIHLPLETAIVIAQYSRRLLWSPCPPSSFQNSLIGMVQNVQVQLSWPVPPRSRHRMLKSWAPMWLLMTSCSCKASDCGWLGGLFVPAEGGSFPPTGGAAPRPQRMHAGSTVVVAVATLTSPPVWAGGVTRVLGLSSDASTGSRVTSMRNATIFKFQAAVVMMGMGMCSREVEGRGSGGVAIGFEAPVTPVSSTSRP